MQIVYIVAPLKFLTSKICRCTVWGGVASVLVQRLFFLEVFTVVERSSSKNEVSEQKQPETRIEPSKKPVEWLIEGLIPKGACVLMEIVD